MNRTHPLPVLLVVLALLPLAGCSKKKPPVSPAAVRPLVAEAPPAPPPPAPLVADPVESPLAGDLIVANDYAHRSGLLGDVYFDFDESDLRPESRDRLTRNAQFLREHPEFVVRIEGHCDERGTNEYNLALGERRAQTARAYLQSLGIAEGRLRPISYGEEQPVCTASDEVCWQSNRRAHFLLVERIR